uniref:Uncharacterized protein n=1 Tax=Setaria digitata TaxID=48799 RepID=A0A915PLC7_9BILA
MALPPKPFLRKRSGVTGRLMEKIHYPTRKCILEQQHLTSSDISSDGQIRASECEVHDSNRPYTAGTADSGCPEDACSVVLSPNSNRKDIGVESVVIDVTNCSSSNSAASSEIQTSRDAPSVIHDLSTFSTNGVSTISPESKIVDKDHFAQKEEIESIRTPLLDVISSETSDNSQDTDGTRSRHWRQVISEFATEANKKTKAERVYAYVKQVGNNAEEKNAILLEKSLENPNFENTSETKMVKELIEDNKAEQNLAKQLRDLIAHMDIANENRHQEYERLEEIFDEALQEKEYFHQQVNELKKRILHLEEDKQIRQENLALLEEAEKIRNADLERLKQENALLNRRQKKKDGSDSDFVNLLKEQIRDLRVVVRDFEQQRSELRTQIRKSNIALKEKNDIIEQLKSDKARLEKRITIIAKSKAAFRGRVAENALSAQAVARAAKSAAVTAATKDLTSQNNEFLMKNSTHSRRNVSQIINVPNRMKDTANVVENTDTLSDSEDIAVVEQGIAPARLGKNVRWNEPLATMASFSPPISAEPVPNTANSDMQLILTENNMIGKASLFRSEKDFTIYTVTHCGCHFYEYSNTDTRWIHSSKLYQINYYGQAGATTLEVGEGKLLVRHFLTGQLEIYRESGETTLVIPNGRRIEIIRDKSGSVRVEIYELDGRVRVRGRGEAETEHRATQTSCYRLDGSYASYIASDDSIEWRSPDYAVHRFKNGDTKVRLNLIDTSVTMLVMDVGTVKHLSNPVDRKLPKYCVEWGTIARKRSRVAVASRSRVLNQL